MVSLASVLCSKYMDPDASVLHGFFTFLWIVGHLQNRLHHIREVIAVVGELVQDNYIEQEK